MAEQKKSSAKAMILPPLVLAVICAVCCAFLALAMKSSFLPMLSSLSNTSVIELI